MLPACPMPSAELQHLLFFIKSVHYAKTGVLGLLWVLAYAGSLLPHFYFKSGIIDPWFNFFIFTGVYFFMRVQMQKKELIPGKSNLFVVLSAFLMGLAIITKGPVALLIFSLCLFIYWLFEKRRAVLGFGQLFLFIIVLLASGGSWFAAEIFTGHSDIIMQFIDYQIRLFKTGDAGHGGPFYFHIIILLIGCFPASIFAFRGMSSEMKDDEKGREVSLWMGLLFWVTLSVILHCKNKNHSLFFALLLSAYLFCRLSHEQFVGRRCEMEKMDELGALCHRRTYCHCLNWIAHCGNECAGNYKQRYTERPFCSS